MDVFNDDVDVDLEGAMPWVGIYIAAASAVCTLAMAADVFKGFRSKRLWFPSKYFSLNAVTLTLLAVVMKLPLDLNTNLFRSPTDCLAKYLGVVFMSTAMANFMSCLGSMSDKELLSNVVALGILVITVSANVLIQLYLVRSQISLLSIIIYTIPTILMLRLLVKLVSIAIMIPTIKSRLEVKFQELHKLVLKEEDVLNRRDAFVIDSLRDGMMKYWMMAETSNPQFVMARTVVCTTSICFLFALTLIAAYVICFHIIKHEFKSYFGGSSYKGSTLWILIIQLIGVAVGTIAPTLRWFAAVSFKCSAAVTNWKSFKKAFKIESNWTQTLVDYRESFSIRKGKCRKCLYNAKWFALTFCIGLQILTLHLGKLFVVFSVLATSPFFLCFILIKKIVNRHSTKVEESVDGMNLNLNRYVVLLDGEEELPIRVLKNMSHDADNMIQTGRKKQPRYLVVHLLAKFGNFHGVKQFDSDQIPSLHSQEPPNCWTLPVVTLTSIAIALPNIPKHRVKKLLRSVSEGLPLAKLVEKTLSENAQLINIRKAADICWMGVELYTKWLDINLSRTSRNCTNSKEVLRELSIKAEGIITKFKNGEKDPIMKKHRNWPAKVVAANSMYRITRTILLSCEVQEENEPADEEFFEELCVMMADILAACFTNLPRVITTMCHRNAIEKREKSVRKAFQLLGETEQAVELVQQKKWPHMDHDKAAYIEEWRALLLRNDDDDDDDSHPATSMPSGEIETTSTSSEQHVAIMVVS
ncbi:hypothetical protein ACS0TY_036046 [Phlomoides rotata]